MATELGALAQVPQMINQVKTMVETLQAVAEVPEAVTATGSPIAAAAIAGLGVAMAAFFVDLIEALDDDVDAVQHAGQNYQANEESVVQSSSQGSTALANFAVA